MTWLVKNHVDVKTVERSEAKKRKADWRGGRLVMLWG